MPLELLSNKVQTESGRPPLLFIHGMWHAAWIWESRFFSLFAERGYRTYALSLPHHGKSSGPKSLNRLRIRDYVNSLRQVLEALHEEPVLVGHSMGGFVVQKYLEQYRAPAAVLLASVPPFGLLNATWRYVKKFPLAFLKANLSLNLAHVVNTLPRYRYLFSSPGFSEADLLTYMQKAQSESFLAYVDMLGLDLVKARKTDTPLLVIGGAEDRAVSVEEVRKTAQRYGVEPVIFPQMGHNLMLEPQSEKVVELMSAWLEEL